MYVVAAAAPSKRHVEVGWKPAPCNVTTDPPPSAATLGVTLSIRGPEVIRAVGAETLATSHPASRSVFTAT